MVFTKSDICANQSQARDWLVLSLFSGAGGLDLGFISAGFRTGLAVDIDPAAVETYRYNHPGIPVAQMDLTEIEPDELVSQWISACGYERPVGLLGGPPCQAFSISNVYQKENDPRSCLLNHYAGIIEAFSLRLGLDFFVFENVPGLVQKRHKQRYQQFKHCCEAAGFKVCEKIVDAGSFGIPQNRKRIIVIGINRKRFPEVEVEPPDGDMEPLPTRAVLEGLPEPVYCKRGLKLNDIPFHPNHIAMVPRSVKFNNGMLVPGDQRGRSFRVLSWDLPSSTVAYGHREIHIHPNLCRRLSVYEAMLLQGFPQWYELKGTFSEQVQLVSDALPPALGEGVASEISRVLGYPGMQNTRAKAGVA